MRVLSLLLVTLLGLFTITSAIDGCGTGGVDFSPLNNYDLSYVQGGWTYVFRMCGIVRDNICLQDTTTINSMVCQRTNSTANNAWNLMTWSQGGTAGTWGYDAGAITYQMSTGEQCNSQITTPRSTTVRFECEAGATIPYIRTVAETATCQYQIYVRTSIACAAPCSFLGVSLSSIGEVSYAEPNNGQYTWVVNMCSNVQDAGCRNDTTTANSMLCQRRNDGADAYSIANYNASAIEFQVVPTGNNAGLLATTRTGEFCGAINANRVARIQLVCNTAATTAYISGVTETSTCNYQVTVFTAATCPFVTTNPNNPTVTSSSWFPVQPTSCGFTASNTNKYFDFNYLMNGPDLLYEGFIGGTYYNVYFHLCGVVRAPQCLNDSTTYNSMFCQTSVTNVNDNWSLGSFVPAEMIWAEIPYGVQYYKEAGEFCGATRRRSTVQWLCNPRVSRDTIISITEPSTCNYLMTIHTNSPSVCNGSNAIPITSNDDPLFPNCVYRVGNQQYDFKTLNPVDGSDLTLFVNNSGNVQNVFMRLCSRVSHTACRTDITSTNSMICQHIPNFNAYSLADYNENNMIWNQVPNAQVIRLKMINGEECGSAKRRTVTVDFVCDKAYPTNAVITHYSEPFTCEYRLTVAASKIMCSYDYTNPDGASPGSSSSSNDITGGMVALIVIVIILGLIVVIGACAAWRYYDRPNAYQKNASYEKNVEMQNAGGEGHSYEVEESQSTV
jgi:hypothetical protein